MKTCVSILPVEGNSLWLSQRLAASTYVGCWQVPGGSVDPGELYLDAARRELREETGLDMHVDRLEPVDQSAVPCSHVGRYFHVAYACQLRAGVEIPACTEPEKSTPWVKKTYVEALSMELMPATADLILRYFTTGPREQRFVGHTCANGHLKPYGTLYCSTCRQHVERNVTFLSYAEFRKRSLQLTTTKVLV